MPIDDVALSVTCWGVRGSIPRPGPKTVDYGGNSSCYAVTVRKNGNEHIFILDAGSGIVDLGDSLLPKGFGRGKGEAYLLMSHYHDDHLIGFPFFAPAFIEGNKINIIGATYQRQKDNRILTPQEIFTGAQDEPYFPIPLEELASTVSFATATQDSRITIGNITVTTCPTNHPQGNLAYRIEKNGHAIVYTGDNEHDGIDVDREGIVLTKFGPSDSKLIHFCRDADILIIDAQYTPEEYQPAKFGRKGIPKKGWGHATYEKALQIGMEAGVKHVVLTHHDPRRTDDQIIEIYQRAFTHAWNYAKHRNLNIPKITMAKEGLTLTAPETLSPNPD